MELEIHTLFQLFVAKDGNIKVLCTLCTGGSKTLKRRIYFILMYFIFYKKQVLMLSTVQKDCLFSILFYLDTWYIVVVYITVKNELLIK